MTTLRRLCWNQKTLTIFLTLNLIVLALILLIEYDSSQLLGSQKTSSYQSAYNRWLDIRSNWDTYSETRARRDMLIQQRGKGLQMDAVVGFDFFQHARNTLKGDESSMDRHKQFDRTSYDMPGPIDFIPPVPEYSDSDIVPYLTENITDMYLHLPRLKYSKKILILTPVCDVAHHLERFGQQLAGLSYPHELLTMYFGEDSSSDRTMDMAMVISNDLVMKYGFKEASAFHFNTSGGVHGSWGDVHHRTSQFARRAHLAKSRNNLLRAGLKRGGDFDFVLWIDSDISELPRDLVQQMMYAKSDVTAVSCLFKSGAYKRVYDKNSWRETPSSIEDQAKLPRDILLVEGYTNTYRIYLPHLRSEGRVVPLDGVGGCSLMIKTECHRKGLKFPEEVFSHHIETEGLAKLAKHLGLSVVGMPFVEVFH